jgi:hypothetical protein
LAGAANLRVNLLKEMLMRTFFIVAVAVALSGAAFAKDLKGSVMTDSEMDKVTAGSPGLQPPLRRQKKGLQREFQTACSFTTQLF